MNLVVDMALLERDEPLERLRARAEAAPGAGSMVLVSGEAGVGKTALVDALAAGTDLRVWWGWCERLFTPRPLGALADIAARAGGGLAEVMRAGAPVHEVFPVLLEELASRPTLLVIEDLQWADDATLDVVALLARRVAMTHSLAVITARDDELGVEHPLRLVLGLLAEAAVERLRLAPLSLDAVRALASASELDVVALFERTGGNPFYVTEVLASGSMDLPPSVRDAVRARVATVDLRSRALLEVLSIVTGVVPLELVRAVGSEVVDRLEICLSSGMLVVRDHGVAFRHELSRAAIGEDIEPLRRAGLHQAVLAHLRSQGADAAELAHHAEEAGDGDAVATFAPQAAEQASARGAHREAAAQYARALRWCTQLAPAARATLLERGAHEHYLVDRFDEAISWLEQAVTLRAGNDQDEQRAEALRQLSSVQRCGGRADAAWESGLAAVTLLEARPASATLAAAHANVAMLALNSHRIHDGLRVAEQALALADRSTLPTITAHALNTKGCLQILAGDDNGYVLLERSLQLALAEGLEEQVGRAYIHLADMAQRHRRFDLAERYREVATLYCAEHGLDLWSRYLAIYHARIDLDRGQWASAVAGIRSVLAGNPGTPLAGIGALVILGLVRARRGDPGAWDALDEARTLAERSEELQFQGPVAAARAEAAWLSGRVDDIDAQTSPVLRDCSECGAPWWAGEIAWWRQCIGIDEPGPVIAAEPWQLMLAGNTLGAAAVWGRIACPYEQAIASAFGEPDVALGALDALSSLGARAAETAVARRLRAVGVRTRPRVRRTTSANPAGLTTREAEVLQFLAARKSNREIADALVVSVKTVDHHVSAILSKLGTPDRHTAARRARELGIDMEHRPDPS
jgi:DNA-binding CsgD family transcriptional regulator/tetratricopeptide (TPR) repeat protein